jgi:hypothetical protein
MGRFTVDIDRAAGTTATGLSRGRRLTVGAAMSILSVVSIMTMSVDVADPAIASAAASCLPDPAAAIAAVPVGGTWNGHGACYRTLGVDIDHPETIENATLEDPATAKPSPGAPMQPIVRVQDTSGVVVKGITVIGANVTGKFQTDLIGEEGFDVWSSQNVSFINDASVNTFGDGLMLWFGGRAAHTATADINVNGLTITNAGRDGITPGLINGATFNNVNIVSSARPAWNFESDLANVGTGPGAFTISNSTWSGGFYLQELETGPVNLVNDTATTVFKFGGKTPVVTVSGGRYSVPGSVNGDVPADIYEVGGKVTVVGTGFGRQATVKGKPATAPAWKVISGGHLALNHSPIPGPTGSHDATSTVSQS